MVEVIVVMAVFAVTISVAFPFLGRFQQTVSLDTVTQEVTHTLRRARHRAMTGQRDSAWGVQILSESYILYAGNSYATRSSNFDELHVPRGSYSFSEISDVRFEKISGRTLGPFTITVSHALGGTGTILINTAGGIFLQ